MSYIPTKWQNGVTPINDENLNKIEQQLVVLTEENEQLKADLETADGIIAQLEVDLATLESKVPVRDSKQVTGKTSASGNIGLGLDSNTYTITKLKAKSSSGTTAYLCEGFRSTSTNEWTVKVKSVQTGAQIEGTDVIIDVDFEYFQTEEPEQTEQS